MGHNSVILSYTISIGIPQVDGRLTNPRILGRYNLISEVRYTIT